MKEFFGIPPSAEFFYFKDAQANVVALLDNSGTVVVKYNYDAWGKCIVDSSTTNTELANLTPFRYRSYNLLMTEASNQLQIIHIKNLTRYFVYSSITSSLLSGWY